MKKVAATLVVVALLFSTGSAWADLDDGVAAYHSGDYEKAFREFLPLAEQGNTDAQNNLGVMYDGGKTLSQEITQNNKTVEERTSERTVAEMAQ